MRKRSRSPGRTPEDPYPYLERYSFGNGLESDTEVRQVVAERRRAGNDRSWNLYNNDLLRSWKR